MANDAWKGPPQCLSNVPADQALSFPMAVVQCTPLCGAHNASDPLCYLLQVDLFYSPILPARTFE